MNVILSCHLDSVFRDPMGTTKNGIHIGSCDNLVGQITCAQLITIPNIHIEWTNGEETNMEGAKWVSNHYSKEENFIIVVDVTENAPRWRTTKFTIENPHNIDSSHIKKALKPLFKSYKIKLEGAESEAHLYKKDGFSCLEVDICVFSGLHNLHNRARVDDILAASQAIKLLVHYIKEVDIDFLKKPLGTKK